ncbi:MAG: AbrB/MazE/SpoVT family DNA-binding domain-containing protein [Candidatus Woesearchaeota archaeon]
MMSIEMTRMSSRGQVVIPLNLREMMGLKDGETFAITGKDDTIVLKKIVLPSFDELMGKTKSFALKKGLTSKDIHAATTRARK